MAMESSEELKQMLALSDEQRTALKERAMEVTVEELHNGWTWFRCGGAKLSRSPRSHLYPAMLMPGEEDQMIACLRQAKEVRENSNV